jgi:membrane protein implicated in regulation of membrane protease activity
MDSTPHSRGDALGVPGLLVVTSIIMIFMVAAISLVAVTGAAWALWLAFTVMLLSSGVLMASIAAMCNQPDDEQSAERSREERTSPAARRSARPGARPVAHGGQ